MGVAGFILGLLSTLFGAVSPSAGLIAAIAAPGEDYGVGSMLFFYGIAGVIGIVLSVLGKLARKKAGKPTGIATAGFVLSIIGTALILINIPIFLSRYGT
jgi:hypothetical protein